MAQHNLGTVIGFEFIRTVTKKRFWISTLSVPVIIGVVFGLILLSNASTGKTADAQKNEQFSISYTDASGLITPKIAKNFHATPATSTENGIQAVQDGKIDAFFAYPASPDTNPVRVYGADQGIFENGKYSAVAEAMLTQAVDQKIDSSQLADLAAGHAGIEVTTYQGTRESGGESARLSRPCCSWSSSTV